MKKKKKKKKKDKKYCKVRDHCQFTEECWGVACSIKYSVPKEIPTVFNNGSNFNYHFIINKLAEEFEKQLTCLGENTEKYITSSVPIEKAITRVNKNAKKSQKLYLTDCNLLTAQDFWQLPNLVNDLAEGIQKIKCKYGHNNKKFETCRIKYRKCECFLECKTFKGNLKKRKCLFCGNNIEKSLMKT